ncbi:MAG: XRE family transcriptional regulator [Sphingobium sp.]
MTMGERIQLRLKVLGMNSSQLARSVGISPQAMRKIVTGETTNTSHIYQIAKALQTTPEYLAGATDEPGIPAVNDDRRGYSPPPFSTDTPVADLDLVEVKEIDLKFGMGATELEIPVTTTIRHFSRDWLRQYTRADPDQVYFAQGIGDSMAPTIHDSDLLIIDTSEQSLRMGDKIWAVAFYGQGMVKRLRQTRDGVQILSDNQLVPPETAHDGELHILGRVVGIVRKM